MFKRIRERKLVQWVVAYAAGAWVMLEVTDTLSDMWGWPRVVGQAVFVVLMVGLVVTVVLAWYHGEQGRQRFSGSELLLLATVLVAGWFLVGIVVRRGSSDESAAASRAAPATLPSVNDASRADLRSLVVLPFADLSPSGDREYLGDGIAETLINGLARIEDLRVVARTSAFRFKGGAYDVREIGRELGVGAVLEGSVVQIGDRVRITAQLVDARNGLDLWSDRFDREARVEDLFALQDEVAQAIISSLEVELGGGAIVHRGTRDQGAQRAYYLARHHWNARTAKDLVRAEELFREAIAADSAYAEAWAGLAETYVLFTPSEYDVPGFSEEEALRRTEETAQVAISLDSTLTAPHAALALALDIGGHGDAAEREYRVAIRKNPGYATAHQWYAGLLMAYARGEEALVEIDVAESLDPVSSVILVEKAEALLVVGRTEEAMAQMERALTLFPGSRVVQWFAAWVFGAAHEWDRFAFHVGRWMESQEEDASVVAYFEEGLADPARRDAILRQIADGETAEVGVRLQTSVGSLNSPHTRFLAARAAYGDDVALEMLERMARGPERAWAYRPLVAALMGPELLDDPRARRILALLNAPRP